jgi:hypothetical protein
MLRELAQELEKVPKNSEAFIRINGKCRELKKIGVKVNTVMYCSLLEHDAIIEFETTDGSENFTNMATVQCLLKLKEIIQDDHEKNKELGLTYKADSVGYTRSKIFIDEMINNLSKN